MKNPRSFRGQRRESGFTLFEIMLVLAIIAVLVGAAIYQLSGNLDTAKEQRVDADVQTIKTQLRVYEMQNFSMPTTQQGLEALVKKPTSGPAPRKWRQLMEAVPLDPWGNPYQYENPGRKTKFDIYSFGPDGRASDDDLPRND